MFVVNKKKFKAKIFFIFFYENCINSRLVSSFVIINVIDVIGKLTNEFRVYLGKMNGFTNLPDPLRRRKEAFF